MFLPLLPTTVFILAAAWCFARSSETFHEWLLNHPKLGPIVKAWREGDGMTRELRNRILLVLWVSMSISMAIIGELWAVGLLTIIGIGITIFLLRQPLID